MESSDTSNSCANSAATTRPSPRRRSRMRCWRSSGSAPDCNGAVVALAIGDLARKLPQQAKFQQVLAQAFGITEQPAMHAQRFGGDHVARGVIDIQRRARIDRIA